MSQFETQRNIIMTLDPVHVGTGGMRLGRVDNSIVREPGTNLPKIPGTALHGAIRQYAAYRYGKRRCAGQGQSKSGASKHCGLPTCPICYTFGFTKGEETEQSRSGVVSIGDARILLFPVYSMAGPVWVTCPSVINDIFPDALAPEINKGKAFWKSITDQSHLNLGWLMVEKVEQDWTPPNDLTDKLPNPIKERIVLLADELFSQVVNSNLEVRTSVSINPETGAAEEKALFTYEAIPRATFLWFDVIIDDYRGAFPDLNSQKKYEMILKSGDKNEQEILLKEWHLLSDKDKKDKAKFSNAIQKALKNLLLEKEKINGKELWYWERSQMKDVESSVKGLVDSGIQWAEHLGIGGMGTRGFGRIRKIRAFAFKSGQNQGAKNDY